MLYAIPSAIMYSGMSLQVMLALIIRFIPAISSTLFHYDSAWINSGPCRVVGLACIEFMSCTVVHAVLSTAIFVTRSTSLSEYGY